MYSFFICKMNYTHFTYKKIETQNFNELAQIHVTKQINSGAIVQSRQSQSRAY